jgi:broad specificity phosphatase PhoE/protein-L-isoaspartate O-methyltransferase
MVDRLSGSEWLSGARLEAAGDPSRDKLRQAAARSIEAPGWTARPLPKETPGPGENFIVVFRHGESEDNRDRVFSGWRDSPLTELGRRQARALAPQLARLPLNVVITSDLARSKETARLALAPHANLRWEEDRRIKERNYGDLTGQSKRVWMEKDPERTSLWRRGYDVPPPHGESLKMVEARVWPFLDALVERIRRDKINVALSAHGNSMRAIRRYFEHMTLEDMLTHESPLGADYALYVVRAASSEPAPGEVRSLAARRRRPSVSRQAAAFDAAAYGAWFESRLGRRVWADEARLILDLLGEIRGSRVLDAGCGDGRLAAMLAAAGARLVGVDLDRGMLGAARGREADSHARFNLVQADIARLPLPNEAVDVVVAVTTLCFVADPIAAVREFGRVLRPGGRLVIGELGRWSTWAVRRRLRAWAGDRLWASARFWTRAALMQLLREAGLTPLAARGAVFYPRSTWLARVLGSLDQKLGKKTTFGAAFVAVSGEKPRDSRPMESA